MATQQIAWDDGSGDKIYVTYPSASGDQTLSVSSDANTGSTPRSKIITIATLVGSPSKSVQLNVSQPGQSLPNYAYNDISYVGASGGSATFGFGGTQNTMISPLFSVKNGHSISFSLGGTNVGHMLYFNDDGSYQAYTGSTSNPRTATPSRDYKYACVCFQKANLASTYVYDNTDGVYLFKGDELASSDIKGADQFRANSPLAAGIIWENARGDFEGWNFAASATANTTNARTTYNMTMYRLVKNSTSTASYYPTIITKFVTMPKNDPDGKSAIQFSLGTTYSGGSKPCLLIYDDDDSSVNYYAANANPRSVTIGNKWDKVRLLVESSRYASSFIKDTTTGTTLWSGA